MSFKNNYRVRKRESESMATIASARFFNSEKERKTIKLWRASQTLKRNHLKKFLSPTNSVQNGLRTETMESSTTGSASDSALFSESLRRLDSLSDKYALWSLVRPLSHRVNHIRLSKRCLSSWRLSSWRLSSLRSFRRTQN
jgi:hypothetical protein